MAAVAQEPDDLYTLRNRFWLGDYQMAIAEGNNLSRSVKDEQLKVEKDEFVYRSYIGLGQYGIVLNEVKEDAPVRLQAVKLLAEYFEAKDKNSEDVADIVKRVDEMAAKYGSSKTESTAQLVCAFVYDREDRNEEAFKAIHLQTNLEQMVLWAQLCLKIWRTDLAAEHYAKLQKIDEDAPLTQLVGAWVNLAHGGDKVKEAAFAYEELIDKFDASISLLNGVACCHMHLGEFDEAEKYLLQAISKGPNPETLVNLLAVSIHLNKDQEVQDRYISQLKTQYPSHPSVVKMIRCEDAFDRVADQMKRSAELKEPMPEPPPTTSTQPASSAKFQADTNEDDDDDDDDDM